MFNKLLGLHHKYWENWEEQPQSTSSTSSASPTTSSTKKAPEAHSALEQAKKWPAVDREQFAQRFLGPHLNNTSLQGSRSEMSCAYWCHQLDLWLSKETPLIPFGIDLTLLKELRSLLHAHGQMLDMQENAEDSSKVSARKTLECIKKDLDSRGYAYCSLGYRQGPLNAGHAITLRVDRSKWTGRVTVHFLNLGAGSHLNPSLVWDANYPRTHFRSFPITFTETDFFGKKGHDLFARQMTLIKKSAAGLALPYSADDVYGAFCATGKASGTIATPEERSRKPQSTPICADLAIELLIRDFFIEKKIPLREIRRFFCNEKLTSILSFSHTVQASQAKNEWEAFARALKEFSTTVLKKKDTSLEPEEVSLCNQLKEILLKHAEKGLKMSFTSPIPPLPQSPLPNASTEFPELKDPAVQSEHLKNHFGM